MYRIAIEKLYKWKNSKRRKPLIIEGARQVGKTWLMKEFGEQAYADTVYINFDSNSRMADLFSADLDTDRLIMGLELYAGRKINPENTLLIFDEVQEVPRALASLKYFYENAPQYHIVCAGSLLGIALHQGTSFPVGKVDFLKLYPLSFSEFLMATGNERFAELLKNQDYEMITSFKQTYIDALKHYYFVGGMPEAVQTFIDTKDYALVGKVQRNLLESCYRDIDRYNRSINRVKVLDCFKNIPAQLSNSNKKFMFSRVDGGKSRNSALKYKGNMLWIEGAGYGNFVYSLNSIEKSLRGHEVRDQFKVYLSDTGMLMEMYGRQAKQDLYSGNVELNSGAIMENVVAENLMKSGFHMWYYRKNNGPGMMEIDMIIELGNDVAAIEVKSGKKRDAPSISKVDKIFRVKRRIKFERSDIYVSEDGIEHYPLFASAFVKEMEDVWDGPAF